MHTTILEVALEKSPQYVTLPSSIKLVVKIFTYMHETYHSIRTYELYTRYASQGGKPIPLAIAALGVHVVGQLDTTTSLAIDITLFTKYVDELSERYHDLVNRYRCLISTFFNRYPRDLHIDWDELESGYFMGSFILQQEMQWKQVCDQTKRMITALYELMKSAFLLSMCLTDICLLFKGDERMKATAMTELMLSWESYYVRLKGNQKLLMEEIALHQDTRKRVLKKLKIEESLHLDPRYEKLESMEKAVANIAKDVFFDMVENISQIFKGYDILPFEVSFKYNSVDTCLPPETRYPPWPNENQKK